MSSMDDSSDRPTFHRLRSDQESERRRMRDRERRRSMTSEQRERHLARRRWNYQAFMIPSLPYSSAMLPVGSGQVLLKVHRDHSSSPKGKEQLAYDLSKRRWRLRLIHVKHFARPLKHHLGELAANNIPILADFITNGNQVSCCKSIHGVRLNHIKELVRGLKGELKETSGQLPMSEAGNLEERNLLPVGVIRHLPLMSPVQNLLCPHRRWTDILSPQRF